MALSRIEALGLLGLSEGFDHEELKRARRRALLRHHPDHGGSASRLAEVEQACSLLGEAASVDRPVSRRASDRPSFTIDVLPVEAFEFMVLAAVELGDVVDEDPPYRLEVRMNEPRDTWVVLEVVPDAGSSTVSLIAESHESFSVDAIRDVWVDAINRLGNEGSPPGGGLP